MDTLLNNHGMPGTGRARLSRMIIGTAQFGRTYGIANQSGSPDFHEICAMLEEAAAAGINGFDTAAGYGECEKILGRALTETGLQEFFFVVTKTDHLVPPYLAPEEAAQAIRASVEQSLRNLQADHLPLVLLHRDESPAYLDALAECRDAGLIGKCGVSFLSVANARRFANHPELAAVQAPANVLDRRFSEINRSAQRHGAMVFARSSYLQGLLLLDAGSTPPHLQCVERDRSHFHALARKLDIGPAALCLRSMLGRADIDHVVVGMETRAQLRANLGVLQTPNLPREIQRRIESFQPTAPSWLMDPFLWDAHATAGKS